jgi:hypothetical protein
MSKPKQGHWILIKRIARYLKGAPRLVQRFVWQGPVRSSMTYVDSDWAGCKKTCKSTSGGAVMLGSHAVMNWSSTQAVVSLSSGEAELYAMTKGAVNTKGMMSLGQDFGMVFHGRVGCDSSAAIGMVNRTGVGKLRHVRVQYLWIQGSVKNGEITVTKVPGLENPADVFTKYLDARTMQGHTWRLGYEFLQDRAKTAPTLNSLLALLAEDRSIESKQEEMNNTEAKITKDASDDRDQDEVRGERQLDGWHRKGDLLERVHKRSRCELFTPLGVGGSPPARALQPVRITEGKFDDGEYFKRIDSWKTRSDAHSDMGRPWTGVTQFRFRESGGGWRGSRDPSQL